MEKLLFHILIIFGFSSPAFGKVEISIPESRCETVDTLSFMNKEVKKLFSTPTEQGSLGWCYGLTAAELISAEIGMPVSAAHISALFNKKAESNFFIRTMKKFLNSSSSDVYESGEIDLAIKNVLQKKVCLEDDMPFIDNSSGGLPSAILGLDRARKAKLKGEEEYACHEIANSKALLNLEYSIKEIMEVLDQYSLNSGIEKLMDQHCGDQKIKVPIMKIKSIRVPRRGSNKELSAKLGKLFGKIEKKLVSGKPVGISYDAIKVSSYDSKHTGSVIGRKWFNGRCNFKIRNYWGDNCFEYNRKDISACKHNDSGAFWVTDQKFFEMVYKITLIE
ncbi:MAG: hypothetical protein CME64_09975 [Halobacteriovoraceae bacterium]|nr:hypothetical protein [Halobacteriovoraceae bacterium]|tara:strand:+ start:84723 stop:85724 length:1002 start_codon:yes stop_codon:yes gene_type:complete